VWVAIRGSVGVICAGAAEIACGLIDVHPAVRIKIKIVMPNKTFLIVFIIEHYNMEKT
jgi:hypothetical protein